MIILQKISFRNFLSFGDYDTTLVLDSHRLNMVCGATSSNNGAGKSVILDAISFVLFNKSYRGVNKNDLINNQSGRGTIVELHLAVAGKQYKIIRSLKPHAFEIYCEGEQLNKDSARDHQKFLEESILKFDFRAFCQTVILGTAGFIPFMKMSAYQRREFVESMLDVDVFANMSKLLKEDSSEWDAEINKAENQIEILHVRESSLHDLLNVLKNHSEDRKGEIRSELAHLKTETGLLLKKQQELDASIANIALADASLIARKKLDLEDANKSLLDANSRLKIGSLQIKTLAKSSCDSCGQHIDKDFSEKKIATFQAEGIELRDLRVELVSKIEAIEEFLAGDVRQQQSKKLLATAKANNDDTLKTLLARAAGLMGKLRSINFIDEREQEIEKHQYELDAVGDEISKHKQNLSNKKMQKDVFDTAKKILKDGGIKTAIIRQYLPILNQAFGKYLLDLGFKYTISLDENFEETIFSTIKTDLKYTSLSMGERQRVDLAMMFAWRDVARMKNSLACNLLFLDEILDTGLDANGIEDLMNVIGQLTNTNIFVVSHRPEFLADHMERVVTVEKVGGYTRYKEL